MHRRAIPLLVLMLAAPAQAQSIEDVQARVHKRSVAIYGRMAASDHPQLCDDHGDEIERGARLLTDASTALREAASGMTRAARQDDALEMASARSRLSHAGKDVRSAYEALPSCGGGSSVQPLLMYYALKQATDEVLAEVLSARR